MANLLPVFILLLAFCTGLVLLTIPEKNQKLRTAINLVSAMLTIIMIFVLISTVYSGEKIEVIFPLLPDINLVLHADPLSLMFVGLSGVLWFVTTIYAIGYLRDAKHRSRFFGFFSLCVFATLGIALAGNLITFLIFYELLTLVTYPLVVHKGNEASLRAGRIYLRYTMIGGAVLLVGVVWLKSLAGALDFSTAGDLASMTQIHSIELTVIFALLIIGLGVKAALVPFHGWLPEAMAAPAPVSSLLHAVAVVKAGAFGIVRVIYDVYGFEFADSLGVLFYLSIAASFTIVYGSIRALYQDDLKKRLAYSTVSQVSYIALGASIGGPLAATGAVAHLVHQGVMKITMFFSAGNFAEALHIHKVSELDGVGQRMPLTMTALTLAIFGMIGIPPLAGFVTKWYLGAGAIAQGQNWVLIILAFSSLLNAMYLLPIVYRGWFKAPQGEWPEKPLSSKLEIYWMLMIPPVITISFAVLAGLFAASELSPLNWAILIAEQEFVSELKAATLALKEFSLKPWIVILLPSLFASIVFLTNHKRLLIYLAPFCVLPALFFAISGSELSSFTPSVFFGSELILDETSRMFLILASVLWLLAILYAQFYIEDDPRKPTFFIFMLLAMTGCFGLIISQDPFGFITFFTLMSLSSFALVIHQMTDQARTAARTYIYWAIIGEVLVFSGFCLVEIYPQFSLDSHLVVITHLLIILGFGAKVGLFGLHWWLPIAHPVAPVPASAVLSGFMVKAGIIGWIKFIPETVQTQEFLGYLLISLGLTGTLFCAIKGLLQSNPKALLAYSTVSQMGILSMAFGAAILMPEHKQSIILSATLYAMHHGFSKCALFFSVGIAPLLKSNGAVRYAAYLAVTLPALALVGAPFSSGAYAKLLLKESLISIQLLPTFISVSSIFTGLLMVRFVTLMSKASDSSASHHSHSNKYLVLLIICITSVLIMLLWPFMLFETLSLSIGNIFATLWPVACAIIIGSFLNGYLDGYNKTFKEQSENRLTPIIIARIGQINGAAGNIVQSGFVAISTGCSAYLNRVASIGAASLSIVVMIVLVLTFAALSLG